MICPRGARVVVVRRTGPRQSLRGLRIAWLVSQDGAGALIRYRVGGGYHSKKARILSAAVLRDATPRERELGYVVKQGLAP